MFSLLRHINKSTFVERNTGASFSSDSSSTTSAPSKRSIPVSVAFSSPVLVHRIAEYSNASRVSSRTAPNGSATVQTSSARTLAPQLPLPAGSLSGTSKQPIAHSAAHRKSSVSNVQSLTSSSTPPRSRVANNIHVANIVDESPHLFLSTPKTSSLSWEVALATHETTASGDCVSSEGFVESWQKVLPSRSRKSRPPSQPALSHSTHDSAKKAQKRNSHSLGIQAPPESNLRPVRGNERHSRSVDQSQSSESQTLSSKSDGEDLESESRQGEESNEEHENAEKQNSPAEERKAIDEERISVQRTKHPLNHNRRNNTRSLYQSYVSSAKIPQQRPPYRTVRGKTREDDEPSHTMGLIHFDPQSIFTERAGIVLVVENHGSLLFGLARDRKHQEITDFGGGVSLKRDKASYFAAFRELYEESLQSLFLNPHVLTLARLSASTGTADCSATEGPQGATTSQSQRQASKSESLPTSSSAGSSTNIPDAPTISARQQSALVDWNPQLSFVVFNSHTLVIAAWLENVTFNEINERYASRLVQHPRAETDAILWFTLEDIIDVCSQKTAEAIPPHARQQSPGQTSNICNARLQASRIQVYCRIKPLVLELARSYSEVIQRTTVELSDSALPS